MNDTARVFLDCYAQGTEPEGGWTFGKALNQARLDHSPASLERVNMLLDQINAKVKPEREAFLATPGGRNFCALLAYYLVAYVAKKSGARIDWHDLASAQQVLGPAQPLPQGSLSRLVAIADDVGVALLPLGWVEDKLFGQGGAPACADYVAGIGAQLDHAGPVAWAAAVRSLGFLASYAMFMVSEGADLVPTVLRPDPDGAGSTFTAIVDDTADGALRRGRAALREDEGGGGGGGGPRHAAFACEASVTLPGGRTDAIVIELCSHGDKPLAVTVVFPFRAATDPRGFAIFAPQLIEGTVPAEAEGLFNRALEAGIQGFNWPSGSWARYRDAAQADTTSVTPAALDGKDVNDEPPARQDSQAARQARAAAAAGDMRALTQLARMHLSGEGVARDDAKAVALFTQAAEAGLADAQYFLAMCYQDGWGVAQDYAHCVHLYTQAAAQEHAASINNLADKYEHGLGVAQDLGKALALYREAAEQNVIAAWYSLANMYADGRGVARNMEQAVRWMRLAAEHDFLDAKARLRALQSDLNAGLRAQGAAALLDAARLDAETLYELAGRVYAPDIAESLPVAFQLYLHAANKGHADAQLQVGFRYRRGLGVAADVPHAIRWYQRAMASGSPYAAEDMGELFEAGELVPKDLRRAAELYAKAVEAGSFTAGDRLEGLRRAGVAAPEPGKTAKPGWKFW
ncbi:SEL1-like repeat protein [Variovorax sp. E3]|uniref:SEL1-like repeat protein n=1 Tax=Variovorax sp. E3 TaxID=1914993 RepID=UPI0018DB0CD4|nr:SEL1-like repeat protein [Variovorax sp. E3]